MGYWDIWILLNALLMTFVFILSRTMDKVDSTMNAVNEQRELANEIAETLANPIYGAMDVDEVRPSLFIFLSCCSPHAIIRHPPITLFERMSENALSLSELHDKPQRSIGRAESGTRRTTARRAE